MSKSLHNTLEEILTCPLSFELFKSPVKPDCCDHVFEGDELAKWKRKQEENNRNNPDKTIHFNCPICRTRIKSFATDSITVHLLKIYANKQAERLKKIFPNNHIDNRTELLTQLVIHRFTDKRFLKILLTQHFFLDNPLSREAADQWLLKSLAEYTIKRTEEAHGANPKIHRRGPFGYSCYTKTMSSKELQQLIKTHDPKHFHTLRRKYWLTITSGRLYNETFRIYIAMRRIRPHLFEHSANAWARITRKELKQSKPGKALALTPSS